MKGPVLDESTITTTFVLGSRSTSKGTWGKRLVQGSGFCEQSDIPA